MDKWSQEAEDLFQEGMQFLQSNPADIRKALNKLSLSAQQGHTESHFRLGCLYLFGEPTVLRNYRKAFECFKIAADDGIAVAQFYLGDCYLFGCGTEKDTTIAFENYKNAAKQNVVEACCRLSEMYQFGIGVECNIDQALYYNSIARGHGNLDAEIRYRSILMRKGQNQE